MTRGHGRWLVFDCLSGCITPQAVKAVMFPHILSEDVNHNIAVVDENPDGSFRPFSAQGAYVLSFESIGNMLHHGLGVTMRTCGADHHVVSNGRQFADLKHDNTRRFCFESSLRGFAGFESRIQGGYAPCDTTER